MNTVEEVHEFTRAREQRHGFSRTYPRHPMIDMKFKLKKREVRVFNRFREAHPFRMSPDRREYASRWLVKELSKCYGMPIPDVAWEGDGMGDSGSSSYSRADHSITLRGHWSYITLLHEFAHSLGFGEEGAVWYSVNAFRRSYPSSFWRLKNEPGTHFLFNGNQAPEGAITLQRPGAPE
jgi:hypothetical protein